MGNVISFNEPLFHFMTFDACMFPPFRPCKVQGVVSEDYIVSDDKVSGTITEDTSRSIIQEIIFFNEVIIRCR